MEGKLFFCNVTKGIDGASTGKNKMMLQGR
jgi:hypothetical protein